MSVEQRAPEWITFLRADEWGRKLIHSMHPEKLNDPETYVHHTAGNPHATSSAVEAMLELQRFSHGRGYATVAYDAVQHATHAGRVTIMEGRGAWRSAATRDRNEEGEAYCLMGYFHPGHSLSKRPTDREIEAAAWGIAWMIEQGWSSRDTTILGHRDNPRHPNATTCPGDWLYEQLPTIRRRVAEIINPAPPPPIITPPTEDDAVFVNYVQLKGTPHVYEQWSNRRKTWVPNRRVLDILRAGQPGDIVELPDAEWMIATGPISGPKPAGVDEWGRPLP